MAQGLRTGSLAAIGQPYRQKLVLEAPAVLRVPFFFTCSLIVFVMPTRPTLVNLHPDDQSGGEGTTRRFKAFTLTRLEESSRQRRLCLRREWKYRLRTKEPRVIRQSGWLRATCFAILPANPVAPIDGSVHVSHSCRSRLTNHL